MVLSPSLCSSHLRWKSWGLWKQNMSFSSSAPEELEISLETRERQGVVILNSCVWVMYSTDLVRMNPITLPMGQAFLAATSPSCGSSHFQPAVWCGGVVHTSQCDKCPSLSCSSYPGFVPQQKQHLCLASMGWLSLKPLTSMWKTLLRKVSEAGKQTTVLWAQTREEMDCCPEVL